MEAFLLSDDLFHYDKVKLCPDVEMAFKFFPDDLISVVICNDL